MGRLLAKDPLPGNSTPRLVCSTCGCQVSKDHRPDSNDCIAGLKEKRWSQADWND